MNRRDFLTMLGLTGGSLMLPSIRPAFADEDRPLRFLLFYTSQGTVPNRWTANPEGNPDDRDWTSDLNRWSAEDFSDILRPLHPWRSQLGIVDGLGLVSAEEDGSGFRHERSQAHSLTGANAAWEGGFPWAGQATVDQQLADVLARADRYRSLELSVYNGLAYDGYGSVIYRGRNQPVPMIDDPRRLWDRLFGSGAAEADRLAAHQGSVLDAVASRYASLAPKLSVADRAKLDQHRELVRGLEQRVNGLATATCGSTPERAEDYGDYERDFANHRDVAVAALACDLTRVVSIQMGQLTTEQLGRPPGDVHAEYAHEIYTSREGEEAMTEYGRVHAAHFASILAALDAVPEGSGTLLDRTVVVWMSEMADSWHGMDRYPVVYAGGGGVLNRGVYAHYARTSPYRGLVPVEDGLMGIPHQKWLQTLMTGMGAPTNAIGVTSVRGSDGMPIDCTGTLAELLP